MACESQRLLTGHLIVELRGVNDTVRKVKKMIFEF